MEQAGERGHVIPGGTWISPQNGATIGDTFELAAFAYPTQPGDPAIQYVNFTVGWSGYWQIAHTVHPKAGPLPRLFKCSVMLNDLFSELPAPSSTIQVSFDVYDEQGNKNLAPHGTRSVLYQPGNAQASENPLEKGLSWLEQSVRRIKGTI